MTSTTGDSLAKAAALIDTVLNRFGLMTAPTRSGVFQWDGSYDGHTWHAWLGQRRKNFYFGDIRARRTIGYKLRIEAQTPVMMRAYILRAGFATNFFVRYLNQRRGLVLMQASPLSLSQFRIVTRDPEWMASLLARPEALSLISSLVEYRSGLGECAEVYFEPGRLHYASAQMQLPDISEEKLATTMTQLSVLLRVAEQLPAPNHPASITKEDDRSIGRLVVVVAAIMLGGLLALAAGALAIGALVWLALR
jgi:hypothetical protein